MKAGTRSDAFLEDHMPGRAGLLDDLTRQYAHGRSFTWWETVDFQAA